MILFTAPGLNWSSDEYKIMRKAIKFAFMNEVLICSSIASYGNQIGSVIIFGNLEPTSFVGYLFFGEEK